MMTEDKNYKLTERDLEETETMQEAEENFKKL